MAYDRALTVFSPDGHLFQMEYALEAANRGTLALAVVGKSTIVLATEKKVPPKLQKPKDLQKICQLDSHAYVTFAGLNADAKFLIDSARAECQGYRMAAGEPTLLRQIVRYVAGIEQKYTQRGGVRPFGVLMLIAGFDPDGSPRLFLAEPSGVYSEWKANAIGNNSKVALKSLEKLYRVDLDDQTTTELAIRAIVESNGDDSSLIEVAVLQCNQELRQLPPDEIESHVQKIKENRSV